MPQAAWGDIVMLAQAIDEEGPAKDALKLARLVLEFHEKVVVFQPSQLRTPRESARYRGPAVDPPDRTVEAERALDDD